MLIQPKRYTLAVLLSAFILLVCQFTAMVLVDPLQLFHKPWFRDDYFIKEMRFQAAGIIRNTEFDSIILGTSMAANFSPREASQIWDTTFVNISPGGSWLSDRSVILKFALARKPIKNAVISLDDFHGFGERRLSFSVTNYDYLYNENRWDDLKVYLNLKYGNFLLCRNIIISSETLCKNTRNLDTVAEWFSFEMNSKRFGGLNRWFESKDNGEVQRALMDIVTKTRAIKNGTMETLNKEDYAKKVQGEQASFDHYVMHYIKKNPGTRFYLYFPPHSRLSRSLSKKATPSKYSRYIERIRYVVSAVERYPNAKAFGFDHLEFTNDIANYMDHSHYHPRFNSAMLRWMKHNDHALTRDNVEAYIKTISELAENYDVVSFGERIESFMGEAYSGSE